MAIFPLIFLIQPLVVVFALPGVGSAASSRSGTCCSTCSGIPVLAPAMLAAYAVAGERQQGSLEPVLTTPIRREEFLLGKALAALVPSVAIAYVVYAVFLACVALFAQPAVAAAVLQRPDIARPGALHAAARGLVDLGRHRDLGPLERRPRRPAAQPPRRASRSCS